MKADHVHNGLGAAIKALTDVVAPSLDADDPLAREQLQLVVDYLDLVRARTDLLWDRERVTLRHYLAMAEAIGEVPEAAAPSLAGAVVTGRRTLADSEAGVRPLRDAGGALAAALSELVRALGAPDADPALRTRVEAIVVDASDTLVDVERAWYLPLGFDPEPEEVAPVQDVLRDVSLALRLRT